MPTKLFILVLCAFSICLSGLRIHTTLSRVPIASSQSREPAGHNGQIEANVAQIQAGSFPKNLFGEPQVKEQSNTSGTQSTTIGSVDIDGQRWELRRQASGQTNIVQLSDIAPTTVANWPALTETGIRTTLRTVGLNSKPTAANDDDSGPMFADNSPPLPGTIFIRFVVPACSAC